MPEPSSPAPFPAPLDHRLLGGRYRLGAVIATGGMAQVRRARDEVLGRDVAVKILHPHLAADPLVVDRFRHEAVAAARLTHPAIVSIYDTVEDDGINAIVMELIEGMTLRQYLDEQGALPPHDAVDVVAGVADALQTAHESGIVHRDVKPANILLCDDRRVMVTDFGIAKAALDQDLTQAGTVIGTAKYLAPEQVRGERVDPRTDVYSLGVVLYECLTGRPPFEADTEAATALARLHRDPLRPRQVLPSVPKSLDVIAMQALSRDPEGRPATASAMRAALLAAAPDEAASAGTDHTIIGSLAAAAETPDSFVRSERRWLLPTTLVVLVGGALILAGVLIGRTEAGQQLIERARDVVSSNGQGGSAASTDVITIERAQPFDPFGSGPPGENDDQAALAVDGNPDTAWPTEFYSDRQLGTKPGVGLVVHLTEPADLQRVVVTSPSDDWSAEIYVAETAPDSFEAWGEPVASRAGLAPGPVTFELPGGRAGAVLVWITDLGPGPAGELRVEIAEVTVGAG
ncbi:MAG: serine/threonine protein kinase [Acidimicrobiia bacterium]|nr:serine/threonine protein kinase [Acidimicrobiia bacterium]